MMTWVKIKFGRLKWNKKINFACFLNISVCLWRQHQYNSCLFVYFAACSSWCLAHWECHSVLSIMFTFVTFTFFSVCVCEISNVACCLYLQLQSNWLESSKMLVLSCTVQVCICSGWGHASLLEYWRSILFTLNVIL